MKTILLSQEKITLVDDEDYEWLNQWKWFYHNYGYAVRIDKHTHRLVLMHREIIKTPKNMKTDHHDGNGLNNQKINLRICTNSENMCNRGKTKYNLSGFKGVTKQGTRWRAAIEINQKTKKLGCFSTPEDAAHAYDKAAQELHGEFAKTNF